MRKPLQLSILFIGFNLYSYAQPTGYNFMQTIEVDHTKVAGDLTQFPLLISVIEDDLKHVDNGGNIEEANGYDIIFTSDDQSTILDHQIEKYDPATGELVVWVGIPTLSSSSNTSIEMYYGNSSIATDPSTTDVWDSNFERVLHLDSVTDGTVNGLDGTNNGSSSTSGIIGNGRYFDGVNDYISVNNQTPSTFTISAWINPTSLGANANAFAYGGSGIIWSDFSGCADDMIPIALRNNRLAFGDGGGCAYDNLEISTVSVSTSNWYFVAVTRDGSDGSKELYINGELKGSSAGTGTQLLDDNTEIHIGGNTLDSRYFNGLIDETRFSTIVRSSDWLLTEYNNQLDPSSFYTFTDLSLLPVELISFDTEMIGKTPKISWITAKETNNKHFELLRSYDGKDWDKVTIIDGAGTTNNRSSYSYSDKSLCKFNDKVYYMLKLVDNDGSFRYSNVKYIQTLRDNKEVFVYPNPAYSNIFINMVSDATYNVKLSSIQGNVAFEKTYHLNNSVIDVSNYPSGIYLIKIQDIKTLETLKNEIIMIK
ncbi:DUF2341 domain-containing protein [Chondrinema litorale]|uniref:DUF2341 domain-containing protein n=1 Tax=Chondrinema litorale TaxID=2994555 RepID=UPI00254313B9|nr:DUF2341 domain-containing protein [Chondrinema litorale]UZR99499.1 DUF2341 domain-containing protein [Chondrinema litorale]